MMLAVSLLGIVSILAVGLSIRIGVKQGLVKYQALERTAKEDESSGSADHAAQALSGQCCSQEAVARAAAALNKREVLFVIGEDGGILAQAGAPLANLRIRSVRRDNDLLTLDAEVRNGQELRSIALRLHLQGIRIMTAGQSPAELFVVRLPAEEVDAPTHALFRSIDRWLLVAIIAVTVLVLFFTWLISRRIFGPIVELRSAAQKIGRGDLKFRVPVRGTDEVGDLASSFNKMADDLEQQQELRRNIVHDVVHELRTPLTALRCRLEKVVDGLAEDPIREIASANEQVDHLSQLVTDLEEVALAEARELKFAIVDTDLNPVLRSALDLAALSHDSRVNLQVEEAFRIQADPVRVRQVLLNLLSNAVRYTPPDGQINVIVAREGSQIRIDVSNTGSALSEQELTRVFDRFYRVDASRQRNTGGSGLGLAIAKHLTEAQGGHIAAASDGQSVTFTLHLATPASPAILSNSAVF